MPIYAKMMDHRLRVVVFTLKKKKKKEHGGGITHMLSPSSKEFAFLLLLFFVFVFVFVFRLSISQAIANHKENQPGLF